MSSLPIVKYGSKVLRQKTEPVKEVTDELQDLAEDMLDTMYDAPGVGLAAPQVGQSVRLMVVDVNNDDDELDENLGPHIFFNPEITETSGEYIYEEGCLSFPGIYVKVTRPEFITVKALDINGEPFELKNVDGLLARCILHEMDHLNGILFVDKIPATDKLLLSSKLKKLSKQTKSQ
jgi:peptide deformylase